MFSVVTDRKIRVAIVGCGRITKNHFGAFAAHANDIELSAICDSDSEVLEAHAKQYGVPGYTSLDRGAATRET